MKAWFFSLCLFLVLIGMIIANAIYVHRTSKHICSLLETLSFEGAATKNTLDELQRYWDQHRPFIALSIGYRDLDHVCETLISLRASYEVQSAPDFELYRQVAADAVRDLGRLERFSIENLF